MHKLARSDTPCVALPGTSVGDVGRCQSARKPRRGSSIAEAFGHSIPDRAVPQLGERAAGNTRVFDLLHRPARSVVGLKVFSEHRDLPGVQVPRRARQGSHCPGRRICTLRLRAGVLGDRDLGATALSSCHPPGALGRLVLRGDSLCRSIADRAHCLGRTPGGCVIPSSWLERRRSRFLLGNTSLRASLGYVAAAAISCKSCHLGTLSIRQARPGDLGRRSPGILAQISGHDPRGAIVRSRRRQHESALHRRCDRGEGLGSGGCDRESA